MRKLIFIIITGILSSVNFVYAQCNMCSVNGCNYMGILPQFQKNLAGLKWNNRSFEVKHLPSIFDFSSGQSNTITDKFNMMDIWGRINLLPAFQVFVSVPVNNIQEIPQTGSTQKRTGMGDAIVSVYYTLFNTDDTLETNWLHFMLAGGGVEFPTGKSAYLSGNGYADMSVYFGSGSFDFPLNIAYTLRYKKTGINIDANYSINTADKYDYKYGNRFGSSLKVFYWKNYGQTTLLPGLGFIWESSQKNLRGHFYQLYSGGTLALVTADVEMYYENFAFGSSFQQPVFQHLSNGLVKAEQRLTINVTYMF